MGIMPIKRIRDLIKKGSNRTPKETQELNTLLSISNKTSYNKSDQTYSGLFGVALAYLVSKD